MELSARRSDVSVCVKLQIECSHDRATEETDGSGRYWDAALNVSLPVVRVPLVFLPAWKGLSNASQPTALLHRKNKVFL